MLVTIAVPTFNSAKFLRPSLDSIFNQDYENFEVLVSDNCSTDSTYEILEEYREKYSNMRLFRQASNIGYVGNFNFLLKNANGSLVGIYHSDDIYEKTIVSKCVEVFTSRPDVDVVSTLGHSIDADGCFIKPFHYPKSFKKGASLSLEQVLHELLVNDELWLITPSVMFKMNYRHEVYFEESARSATDYNFWLSYLSLGGKMYLVNEDLISYRYHSEQLTEKLIFKNPNFPDVIQVYRRLMKTVSRSLYRDYLRKRNKLLLSLLFKLNYEKKFDRSIYLSLRMLKYGPLSLKFIILVLLTLGLLKIRLNFLSILSLISKFR